MQCAECETELQGKDYLLVYGFYFCVAGAPENKFVTVSYCKEKFERKLWQAAQADKQAERKTESAAPEASGD